MAIVVEDFFAQASLLVGCILPVCALLAPSQANPGPEKVNIIHACATVIFQGDVATAEGALGFGPLGITKAVVTELDSTNGLTVESIARP